MRPTVAIVFGGTGGIGSAISKLLINSGYRVAVTSRVLSKSEFTAQNLIAPIRIGAGATNSHALEEAAAIGLECDATDDHSVQQCFQHVERRWTAPPSLVVNAAGINEDRLLMKMEVQTMKNLLETNLLGAMITSKMAARSFLKSKRGGAIVNIGSVVATHGNVGQTAYSASKAGLIGLTMSLAKELAPRDVRVNLVSPGFIETDMTRHITMDHIQSQVLLQRFGRPEEVAEAVKFLATATYITGTVITVDGGLHLGP